MVEVIYSIKCETGLERVEFENSRVTSAFVVTDINLSVTSHVALVSNQRQVRNQR